LHFQIRIRGIHHDSIVLFQVFSDIIYVIFQHAVAFVKEEVGPEAAARKLTEIAFRRGSTDNITCIVIEFQRDNVGNGSPPFSCQR
jgi:serine/threonine protein phosphatase PrpC